MSSPLAEHWTYSRWTRWRLSLRTIAVVLFTDGLGWERTTGLITLHVEGRLSIQAIAQKRGCRSLVPDGSAPSLVQPGGRCGTFSGATPTAHEHILIVTSEVPRKQVWLWAVRLPDGRSSGTGNTSSFSNNPPSAFCEPFAPVRFNLAEEENVSLVDALDRVRQTLTCRPRKPVRAEAKVRGAQRSLALAMKLGRCCGVSCVCPVSPDRCREVFEVSVSLV